MSEKIYWGYEEREPDEPLRMALLPMSLEVLKHAYFIPAGYEVVGLHFDETRRTINFLLLSPHLPVVQEGQELPRVELHVTVDYLDPKQPEYRRYTPEIKLS